MNWKRLLSATLLLLGCAANVGNAQSLIEDRPKAIPQDRATMLKALEDLKHRTPRLPFIESEPEEPRAEGSTSGLGVVNNGRMRRMYLPAELQGSGGRASDPAMTLTNEFAVELFWIASRVNNCHYCLGHQESKLKRAGLTEDMLLWLDTDWKRFSPREQAGFEFARLLSFSPHLITDQTIEKLKPHFQPLEILEMAYLVGRYNATNRWTDSLGIPQEEDRDYTSTLQLGDLRKKSVVVSQPVEARMLPADMESWQRQLASAKSRVSRLPLVDSAQAGVDGLKPHESLLLNFPIAGKQWLEQWETAHSNGQLPDDLRASILFVCAIEDRAFYVQHLACKSLLANGWTEERIFGLLSESSDEATNAALHFARKLTSQTQSMSDQDVENLKAHFTPQQIAEIVYRVGLAAHLNRVTETAGLGWK